MADRLGSSLTLVEEARRELQAQYALWRYAVYGMQTGVRRAQVWGNTELLVLAVAG